MNFCRLDLTFGTMKTFDTEHSQSTNSLTTFVAALGPELAKLIHLDHAAERGDAAH